MKKNVLILSILLMIISSFKVLADQKDITTNNIEFKSPTSLLINVPFGEEKSGKDVAFKKLYKKCKNDINFYTQIQLRGMGCVKHFGDDGKGAADWSIDGKYMRFSIENNGSANIKCYITKYATSYHGTLSYNPITIKAGTSFTDIWASGAGNYSIYVVNGDGSYLNGDLRIRDLNELF